MYQSSIVNQLIHHWESCSTETNRNRLGNSDSESRKHALSTASDNVPLECNMRDFQQQFHSWTSSSSCSQRSSSNESDPEENMIDDLEHGDGKELTR